MKLTTILAILSLMAALVWGQSATAPKPQFIVPSTVPQYSATIPNGDRVFVNGHRWPALLAATWRGTTGALNPFGSAFSAAGSWTAALCAADSDGDGFTNGEELGDPNCVWVPGATPSRVTGISHPGLYSSIPFAVTAKSQTYPKGGGCARDAASTATSAERLALRSALPIPGWVKEYPRVVRVAAYRLPNASEELQYFPNTGRSCPYSAADLVDWHDATIWPGSTLPVAGSNVTIPAGKKVLVSSCSLPAAGFATVTVPAGAELIFADAPINLRIKQMSLSGALRIGSPTCEMYAPITVTFYATKSEQATYGNGITVMDNGVMDVFGARNALTWTRLAAPVVSGATTLVLQDAVEWSVYEEILVVTSTYRDEETPENEVRMIAAVDSTTMRHLRVAEPFNYSHYAGAEYQTEVALLWRSILFRGVDPSDLAEQAINPDQYGGHTMAMGSNATYRLVGVRAQQMGQRNVMARYPFHMHMMFEAGPRCYFQELACVSTFYRCLVIHGTNRSLMRKNVAFDVSGHTFYLEDGAEMYNRIEYNLAAYIHPIGVPPTTGGQPGDTFVSDSNALLPADHAASGYYISNPQNYVVGNAASGGFSGFAYPTFDTPLKLSSFIKIEPKKMPALEFDGNSAHSAGYYWNEGGCIYFGARLWEDTSNNNVLTYTNGRISQPTIGWHNVTNTRVWLCNKGFLSWGERVDMRAFEVSDSLRPATLFGASSYINALAIGTTANVPAQLRNVEHNGFTFYDTWVQTVVSNVTFVNYFSHRSEQDYIFDGLTHSDIFRPWGISATKNIRFEGVNRGRILNPEKVKESGSSRDFNFVDWDSSATNGQNCEGTIVGSNITWWNVSGCWYDSDWLAWKCPRIPGREVVGLDMLLPGINTFGDIDIRPDSQGVLTDAQRASLYVGHMSQFGAASDRRHIVTRNHWSHLVTGLSGIGWYLYSSYGMPTSFTVEPKNFPRGAYILLALDFPADATFKIWVERYWNPINQLNFTRVNTRDDVVASNGTAYAFDGQHLYLKISDLHSPYPNAYTRDDVSVYDVYETYNRIWVHVQSSQLNASGTATLPPAGGPNPPAAISLPITVCDNATQFLVPPPLCPQESDILPSTATWINKTCADYKAAWRCGPGGSDPTYQYCRRTCLPNCTRLAPYPYTCSMNRTQECKAAQKPAYVPVYCDTYMEGPYRNVMDPCLVRACNYSTGNAILTFAPADTPCPSGWGQEDGKCTSSGSCTAGRQVDKLAYFIRRAIAPDASATSQGAGVIEVTVVPNVTSGASVVAVLLNHPTAAGTAVALQFNAARGTFSGVAPNSLRVIRAVNVSVVASNGTALASVLFADWTWTADSVPTITFVRQADAGSGTSSDLVFSVSPVDWVSSASLRSRSGAATAAAGSVSYASGEVTFMVDRTASVALDYVQLGLFHGLIVTRTFGCLLASSAGERRACKTEGYAVLGQEDRCAVRLAQAGSSGWWFQVRPTVLPGSPLTAKSVVGVTLLRSTNASASNTTWGDFTLGVSQQMTSSFLVMTTLADGRTELHNFTVPFAASGTLLPCVSGVLPARTATDYTQWGADGLCDFSGKACRLSPWDPATATATPLGATPVPGGPAPLTSSPSGQPPGVTPSPQQGSSSGPPSNPTTFPTNSTANLTPVPLVGNFTGVNGTNVTQSPSIFNQSTSTVAPSNLTSTSGPLGSPATSTASPTRSPSTPVTPTAVVVPSGTREVVTGTVRIQGSNFAVLLNDPGMNQRLSAAIRSDLAGLLQVQISLLLIKRLSLGSLVVDYSLYGEAVSSAVVSDSQAKIDAAVGSNSWLVETTPLYSQVSNDTLALQSGSAKSSQVESTTCGFLSAGNCIGFFLGVILGGLILISIGVGVVLWSRSRNVQNRKKAAPTTQSEPYAS